MYYQSYGKEPQAVVVPTGTRSGTYRYVGPNPLVFFKDGGVDAEGNPIQIPVASFPVEAQSEDTLLNFFSDQQNEGRYRLLPIKEGLQTFPFGTCMFYNFCGEELAVKLGDETSLLQERQNHRFGLPTGDDQNFLVQIADNRDGEWKAIYSSVWGAGSDLRLLVLAIRSPRNPDRVEIKMLRENQRSYNYSKQAMVGAE